MGLPRVPFDLDAFELGCFIGLIQKFDREDPVRIHLSHRLMDAARSLYAKDAVAEAAAKVMAGAREGNT